MIVPTLSASSNSFIRKFTVIVSLISSLVLFNSCFEFEELNFKGIEKYELVDQKADELKLRIYLRIENLNKFAIILKKSDLDLQLNDTFIGTATTSDKVKLDKKTEAVYPITLTIKGKGALKKSMEVLGANLNKPVKFSAKGKVTGKAYGISKTMDVAFSEKLNLSDFIK